MAEICMNQACQVKEANEWKLGWNLKSGGYATLCYNCGTAYENLVYCETFHLDESGWRECGFCGKRLHLGCIASKYMHEYLDFGGVGCVSCVKVLESQSKRKIQTSKNDISNGFGTSATNGTDIREGTGGPYLHQGQNTQNISHKSLKNSNRLLRYSPKITEEQLLQMSRDLNSAVVPLFEKVLSASDVGSGRLILPRSCAEGFFPPISQSESKPVRIHDTDGKECTFVLRFLSNSSSRQYVLEGITPLVHNRQLQAGDIATFIQTKPDGKLVMDFRKALKQNDDSQADKTYQLPYGALPGEIPSFESDGNSSMVSPVVLGNTTSTITTQPPAGCSYSAMNGVYIKEPESLYTTANGDVKEAAEDEYDTWGLNVLADSAALGEDIDYNLSLLEAGVKKLLQNPSKKRRHLAREAEIIARGGKK